VLRLALDTAHELFFLHNALPGIRSLKVINGGPIAAFFGVEFRFL